MNDRVDVDKDQAEKLFRALRKHLGQSAKGRQLITAFENDPQGGGAALADYLREHLPADNSLAEQIAKALGRGGGNQFATVVTGGQVDQIINIARLGVLNLTLKKHLFVFRDIKQVVVFFLVVLIVGAGAAYGVWLSTQPQRMDADFNIAVAQFGEVTDKGVRSSGRAAKISNSLFNFLDSEFKTSDFGLDVQVGHKNIPIIVEDLEAERLAQRINADMVIYGDVYVIDGYTAEFSPRFFVADHPDTSELTGQSELAHPIPFDISALRFQDEVNVTLRTRAAILIHFTEGLVYLSANNLAAATHSFQDAIREAERHSPFEGMEALYLFIAHVNRRQEYFEEADKNVDQALFLNPEYARAYLARGNISYAQAISSWDQMELARALSEYEKALEADDHSPGAYIREKANASLGNIYVVQAQQTGDLDLFAKAIDHYSQVTSQYEETKNQRIRGLAAIAYFGLGAAYERQKDYTRAAEAYKQCVNIVSDVELRSRAEMQLGVVQEKN